MFVLRVKFQFLVYISADALFTLISKEDISQLPMLHDSAIGKFKGCVIKYCKGCVMKYCMYLFIGLLWHFVVSYWTISYGVSNKDFRHAENSYLVSVY